MSISTAKLSAGTTMKRVGIWIRVSTEDQVRGESPEHHETRARMYAQMKGWEVMEVYRLDAVSGRSVKDHPETKRMLENVKTGRITGLIFSKLARLARNTRELLDFADFFREHEADLISLQESIDTSTPAGRLFYTMIAALAQWEREEIAARVAASVPIRAKLGKPLGGAATFGYQWMDKRLVPHSEEAPIRRLEYDLYLQHKRLRAVARILNERGYRTRGGRPFTDTTVRRHLEDPTAKGLRRANYTRSLGPGKWWAKKDEREWVHVEVEPIVPTELWEEANRLLQENTRHRVRKPRRHCFSGLVHCARCQKRMQVHAAQRGRTKFRCACGRKLAVDDLETMFRQALEDYYLKPEHGRQLADLDQELQDEIETKGNLLKTLRAEAAEIERQIDALIGLWRDELIDRASFAERIRPLEKRRGQIGEELPRLEGELDFLTIRQRSTEVVIDETKSFAQLYPSLTEEKKLEAIETILERAEVGDGETVFSLYYLPEFRLVGDKQPILRGSWRRPA